MIKLEDYTYFLGKMMNPRPHNLKPSNRMQVRGEAVFVDAAPGGFKDEREEVVRCCPTP